MRLFSLELVFELEDRIEIIVIVQLYSIDRFLICIKTIHFRRCRLCVFSVVCFNCIIHVLDSQNIHNVSGQEVDMKN